MVRNLDARRVLPFLSGNWEAIQVSVGIQLLALWLAAIVLDGGMLLRLMMLPAIAYWVGIGLMMVRRSGRVDRVDVFLMRWGFAVLVAAGCLASVLLG